MPEPTRPSTIRSVAAPAAAALGTLSLVMLATATAHGNIALLAWGLLTAVLTVSVACVAAVRAVIDDAVERCVDRVHVAIEAQVGDAVSTTAVKVGQAIAETLNAEDPSPPAPRAAGEGNVRPLY